MASINIHRTSPEVTALLDASRDRMSKRKERSRGRKRVVPMSPKQFFWKLFPVMFLTGASIGILLGATFFFLTK